AGQSRLDNLEDEESAVGFILGVDGAGTQLVLDQFFCAVFVRALLLCQIIEQLADAGVGGAGGGFAVEITGLQLHGGGLATDDIERQRAEEPDGLAVDEAFDVLAADEREVIAPARLVYFDQAAAVAR